MSKQEVTPVYMHNVTGEKHYTIKDLVVEESSRYHSDDVERLKETVDRLVNIVGEIASVLTEKQRNELAVRLNYCQWPPTK